MNLYTVCQRRDFVYLVRSDQVDDEKIFSKREKAIMDTGKDIHEKIREINDIRVKTYQLSLDLKRKVSVGDVMEIDVDFDLGDSHCLRAKTLKERRATFCEYVFTIKRYDGKKLRRIKYNVHANGYTTKPESGDYEDLFWKYLSRIRDNHEALRSYSIRECYSDKSYQAVTHFETDSILENKFKNKISELNKRCGDKLEFSMKDTTGEGVMYQKRFY